MTANIPLKLKKETMAKQAVFLLSMKDHIRTDIHKELLERLLQGQVFCQELRPMGYLQWINLFLKDCTLWNGFFLQEFLQSYIPWKRPTSENFMCPIEKRSV